MLEDLDSGSSVRISGFKRRPTGFNNKSMEVMIGQMGVSEHRGPYNEDYNI